MKKRDIKVIKRIEGGPKVPPAGKAKVKEKEEKRPGVADTVKGWITERRENNEAEDRSRRKKFSAWRPDRSIHATSA